MAESRAAKKNKKRRSKTSSKPDSSQPFEISEDVSVPTTKPKPADSLPTPIDPIANLKKQIEEAKAAKDHVKAQELRQKMWVLQDTLVLGKAGPNAPEVDIQEFLPTVKQPSQPATITTPLSSTTTASTEASGDPTEKKLSKLRKKLKSIEALKERQANGEKLETNQVDKIKSESELLDEISILEQLLSGI